MTSFDNVKKAFDAINEDDIGSLLSVLTGVDLSATDEKKRSLLAAALIKRNRAITLLLLQGGADPNGRTEPESIPLLHFAIRSGATGSGGIEMVELLLQSGANIHAIDNAGNSVLHEAANAGSFQLFSSYMTRYLIGAGADVNVINNDGETPLHHAVQTISKETVKILCQKGTSTGRKDRAGRTASQIASGFWAGDEEYAGLASEYAAMLSKFSSGN